MTNSKAKLLIKLKKHSLINIDKNVISKTRSSTKLSSKSNKRVNLITSMKVLIRETQHRYYSSHYKNSLEVIQ